MVLLHSAERMLPIGLQTGIENASPRGFGLRARWAPLAWALCTLFPACGGDGGDPGETPPDPSATPTPTASNTNGGMPVEVPLEDLACAEMNPVPAEGRLLTRLQFKNSVVDLFHGKVPAPDMAAFPPENEVLRFRTNAEFHRATPLLSDAHMNAAEAVARGVAAELASLLPCSAERADEACAAEFVAEFAPRAFRRPLFPSEGEPFLALFAKASTRFGFVRGIEVIAEALVQSPQFLYRLEFGGTALPSSELPAQDMVAFDLTDYEIASRLSYFLYNSMPDEELFAAAAAGELRTAAQIEAQARRMIERPRTQETVQDFYAQWLGLAQFGSVVRLAPGFAEAELAPSWQGSLQRYLSHTFWEGAGDFAALMTSDQVFLDAKLAQLYGVQRPAGLEPGAFFATEFEPRQRSGLLTQPALLALLSHSNQSGPIQRGVFVRDEVLCQPTPPPPPNVDQTPPDPSPSLTTRERFKIHTEEAACAGCHSLIDPIGLGFEQYDHLGRYRDQENGFPVDASGAVNVVREVKIQGPFNGAVELADRLSSSEQVKLCLATQWYRYALGRVEQTADLCSLQQISRKFGKSAQMKDLLVGVALSDAFRARGVPAGASATEEGQ